MARTSEIMLNKSDEHGHLCLIADLSENAFNFSLSSMMMTVCYMAFIMLRYAPSMPIVSRVFNYKLMLNFINSFICLC